MISGVRENTTLRSIEQNTRTRDTALQSLASGKRKEMTPAEQALSVSLLAQAGSLVQAQENTESASYLLQTAEGALNEVSERVRDIQRLAVAAGNTGVYDAGVQQALQTQVQSNLQAIENIAAQTQFNGKNLLDGSHATPATAVTFQTGAEAGQTHATPLGDVRPSALGTGVAALKSLADIDLTSPSGSSEGMEIARAAQVQVAQQAAHMGAEEASILKPNVRALQHRIMAALESNSRIEDADFGAESMKSLSKQILVNTGIAIMSQATIDRRRVLVLLR